MIYRNGACIILRVEHTYTGFKRIVGLMLHRSIKDDYALVYTLERQTMCDVHMLFVLFGVGILFLGSHDTFTIN